MMKLPGWLRGILIALGILIICLLCIFSAVKIVNAIDYHNNDFFPFYLVGRLVLEGGDPYSPIDWVSGYERFGGTRIEPTLTFLYPLPLAFVFTPLALLPLYQAYITWVALSQMMILASLYLLLRLEKATFSWRMALPLLAGLALFRPTILTLVQGQLTAFLVIIAVCILVLWNQERWGWGGVLLSLMMLKPNLGAPMLILLIVWLVVQKKYIGILGLGMGSLFLLVVGIIQEPRWVQQYLGIGSGKIVPAFAFSPTAWGAAGLMCHFETKCSLIAGVTMSAVLVVMALWLILRRRTSSPLEVFSISITITLLVTPYSWTYDQLMLGIPIAATVFLLEKRKGGFLPAMLLFPGLAFFSFLLLLPNTTLGIEIFNLFLPLVVFILFLWNQQRKKHEET